MATETKEEQQKLVYDSLLKMRAFTLELFNLNVSYELSAWVIIQTKPPDSHANLALNILLDLLTAGIDAAGFAAGVPQTAIAMGFISSFIKEWKIGVNAPKGINDTFSNFTLNYQAKTELVLAQIDTYIGTGTGPSPGAVPAHWDDAFQFNGVTHKFSDLAAAEFPGPGTVWDGMRKAGEKSFAQQLWRVIIQETCSFYKGLYYYYSASTMEQDRSQLHKDVRDMYKKWPGWYARAKWTKDFDSWHNKYTNPHFVIALWSLGINRYPFPDSLSAILFTDSIPGEIINPDGLFSRHDVFNTILKEIPDWDGDDV